MKGIPNVKNNSNILNFPRSIKTQDLSHLLKEPKKTPLIDKIKDLLKISHGNKV